jgi:hypothetical protein
MKRRSFIKLATLGAAALTLPVKALSEQRTGGGAGYQVIDVRREGFEFVLSGNELAEYYAYRPDTPTIIGAKMADGYFGSIEFEMPPRRFEQPGSYTAQVYPNGSP